MCIRDRKTPDPIITPANLKLIYANPIFENTGSINAINVNI